MTCTNGDTLPQSLPGILCDVQLDENKDAVCAVCVGLESFVGAVFEEGCEWMCISTKYFDMFSCN